MFPFVHICFALTFMQLLENHLKKMEENGEEIDNEDDEAAWEGWDVDSESESESSDGWINVDDDDDINISDSEDEKEDNYEKNASAGPSPENPSALATTKVIFFHFQSLAAHEVVARSLHLQTLLSSPNCASRRPLKLWNKVAVPRLNAS